MTGPKHAFTVFTADIHALLFYRLALLESLFISCRFLPSLGTEHAIEFTCATQGLLIKATTVGDMNRGWFIRLNTMFV